MEGSAIRSAGEGDFRTSLGLHNQSHPIGRNRHWYFRDIFVYAALGSSLCLSCQSPLSFFLPAELGLVSLCSLVLVTQPWAAAIPGTKRQQICKRTAKQPMVSRCSTLCAVPGPSHVTFLGSSLIFTQRELPKSWSLISLSTVPLFSPSEFF